MDDAHDGRTRGVATSIDLNVDAGEAYGRWTLQDDEVLVSLASSVNVACGFHAGDPAVMQSTVRAALSAGTAIGAHPGYADLRGFGRRAMVVSDDELAADVLYQIGALTAIVEAEGGTVSHVKPHGALYTTMARDASVAWTVVKAVSRLSDRVPIVVQAGTVAESVAIAADVPYLAEAFADRGYARDGQLVPRNHADALLHEPAHVVARVEGWILTGSVRSVDGTDVAIDADTLCLHGDVPGAAARLAAVRDALRAMDVRVAPATPRKA